LLALVRHGQTDWNAAGRLQGHTDVPLNSLGRQQANDAGASLSARGWDVLVSSPLGRAVETAQIIGSRVGLDLAETVPELLERDYRGIEGTVLRGMDRPEIDELMRQAEPEADVAVRGIAGLQALLRSYPEQNIIAVAHGTILRLTLNVLHGTPRDYILNGETVELDPDVVLGYRADPDQLAATRS
jgi:probable phosphoglycerate mutase